MKFTLAILMLVAVGCGRDDSHESMAASANANVSCPVDQGEAEALGGELLQLTPGESLKDAAKRSSNLKRLLNCGWRSETVDEDGTRTQVWRFVWGNGKAAGLVVVDGVIDSVE